MGNGKTDIDKRVENTDQAIMIESEGDVMILLIVRILFSLSSIAFIYIACAKLFVPKCV